MKRLLLIGIIGIIGISGFSQTNGYPPKIQSYGNWFQRLRADSAQHLPHKYSLTQNTTDTTPQVFIYSTPMGDSLVFFVNGVYHIAGTGSGGGGTDSAVINGLWLRRSVTTGPTITLFADSATMSGYLLRRADSVYAYITPTVLTALLAGKVSTTLSPGMILIGNGSGVATPFTVTGDGGFSSSGVFTLGSIIAAGSCTNCNLAYDAKGRIISASTPAGGGFVTAAQLNKNVPGSDTSWKHVSGIPNIDVTGGTTNGSTMPWFWLVTGGNHAQAPDMDSDLYVNSSGHLTAYFETALGVSHANMQDDEVTYPISWSLIGNADNFEWIANLAKGGAGLIVTGNGTNTWQIALNQGGLFSPNIDTVCAACTTLFNMDWVDGSNMNLGPTATLNVRYNGSHGYTLERIGTGLTHQFKFQLKDASGGFVTGYPQAGDSIEISNASIQWSQLDLRQFLTSTNFLFASGLANTWMDGDFRLFPDSNRIGRPFLNVNASGTPGQINITWSRVTNDANGYELQRSTVANFSGGVVTLVNPITLGGTLVTSFNDTGLTTGTTYYYRLRASRISGQYSAHAKRKSAVAP